MAKGQLPDYRLSALNKSTDETRNIGAGWKQPNGRISIKLDAFTVLQSSPDLIITLFPANERDQKRMTDNPITGREEPF
jgi:hypothetical protein